MSNGLVTIIVIVLAIVIIAIAGERLNTQAAFAPNVGPDFVYEYKPMKTPNDAVYLNDPIFIGNNKLQSSSLDFNCKAVGYRSPPQGTNYYTNCRCTHISEATKNCLDETYDIVEVPVDPQCWTVNVSFANSANKLATGDLWKLNPYITVKYDAEGQYYGDAGCYLTDKERHTDVGFDSNWNNKFAFNIDVVNGIDTYLSSGDPVVEIGNTTNITVIVENRIADGIPGGVFVTIAQKGFFTGEITSRIDQNLSIGNTSFQIEIPRDRLGVLTVSIIGFIKVDVPHIDSEGKVSYLAWYGTDDIKTSTDVEVVKHEQLSQFASKTLVSYKSPYKNTKSISSNVTTGQNYVWPVLLSLAALVVIIVIIRRK